MAMSEYRMPPKPPEMAVLSGDASENSQRLFGSSLRRANSWPKKSTQPAAKIDPLCVTLTKSWPERELGCMSWLILLFFTWSSGCRNATALNLGISTAYRTASVRAAATTTARSSSRACSADAAEALVEGGLDILDETPGGASCAGLSARSVKTWTRPAGGGAIESCMVATDSLCAPACVSDRMLVLVLGGWSPGPLDALRWAMRDQEVDFLEPPLHMPPAGIRWCCTWEAVLLACCIWFVLVLVTGGGALPLVQRCALLLACMLALPAAVVLLVCG